MEKNKILNGQLIKRIVFISYKADPLLHSFQFLNHKFHFMKNTREKMMESKKFTYVLIIFKSCKIPLLRWEFQYLNLFFFQKLRNFSSHLDILTKSLEFYMQEEEDI